MKTLVLAVIVFSSIPFAACSRGDKEEKISSPPQVVSTPIYRSEEATLAAPPEVMASPANNPSPTPVVGGCPSNSSQEQMLREVLQTKGDFIGETVSLRIVGCIIKGTYDYSRGNEFAKANPTVKDPTTFPNTPARELREWTEKQGIPEGITHQVNILWTIEVNPTPQLCEILKPELNCYD